MWPPWRNGLIILGVVAVLSAVVASRGPRSAADADRLRPSEEQGGEDGITSKRWKRETKLTLITQDERIGALKAHNDFRSQISRPYKDQPTAASMVKMYWSSELEATAQAWSNKCTFVHGQAAGIINQPELVAFKTRVGSYIGQNLFKGGSGWKMYDIVELFFNETMYFTYQNDGAFSCESGKACGHYTQVVWSTTFLVGCGRTKCGSSDVVTCNYSPGGNMKGSPPYKIGESCSRCANESYRSFTECEGTLCVPKGDICSAVKECAVTDQKNCLCSEAHYNEFVTKLLMNGARPVPRSVALLVSMVMVSMVILSFERATNFLEMSKI